MSIHLFKKPLNYDEEHIACTIGKQCLCQNHTINLPYFVLAWNTANSYNFKLKEPLRILKLKPLLNIRIF